VLKVCYNSDPYVKSTNIKTLRLLQCKRQYQPVVIVAGSICSSCCRELLVVQVVAVGGVEVVVNFFPFGKRNENRFAILTNIQKNDDTRRDLSEG
jgi:hypothetical protein